MNFRGVPPSAIFRAIARLHRISPSMRQSARKSGGGFSQAAQIPSNCTAWVTAAKPCWRAIRRLSVRPWSLRLQRCAALAANPVGVTFLAVAAAVPVLTVLAGSTSTSPSPAMDCRSR